MHQRASPRRFREDFEPHQRTTILRELCRTTLRARLTLPLLRNWRTRADHCDLPGRRSCEKFTTSLPVASPKCIISISNTRSRISESTRSRSCRFASCQQPQSLRQQSSSVRGRFPGQRPVKRSDGVLGAARGIDPGIVPSGIFSLGCRHVRLAVSRPEYSKCCNRLLFEGGANDQDVAASPLMCLTGARRTDWQAYASARMNSAHPVGMLLSLNSGRGSRCLKRLRSQCWRRYSIR